MKNDSLLEIFSILSKAIIIIPVIVVLLALFFRFNKKPRQNLRYFSPPSPTITPKPTNVFNPIKFNLKGPIVCQGEINGASASAFIKDKKIRIIFQNKGDRENILVSGDCFYNWDEGEFSGQKMCGLSPVLSIVETMASFGGLNFELLFNQLKNLGVSNKVASDQAKVNQLVKTCREEKIDERLFKIPTNILFKNRQ